MKTLALIAGQGALPGVLANALKGAGRPWITCHLDGFAPTGVGPSRSFRIEQLGSLIAELQGQGVSEVCFAGGLARPPLDPSAVDAATLPLVPRMMQAIHAGDDAALRTVIAFFEEAGIQVVGAAEIAPSVMDLPIVGAPTARDLSDIERAAQVHAALGSVDVGQGCVVAAGQVLAVEATPGTDWMLATLAMTAQDGASHALPMFSRPSGGVFFKAAKPGQDRRIDLPTIGPETVRRVAAAGLHGIAVEQGGVMVLDPEAVLSETTSRGLFLTAWQR